MRGPADSPEPARNLAAVRRGFELFNSGDLDMLFTTVFHADVDYSGDPDVSALAGFPVDAHGVDAVRAVWEAFFAMCDEVHIGEIELEAGDGAEVFGRAHMVARGGSSEVPIDAPFHFAWQLRDGRWTFMSAKLDREAAVASLKKWQHHT